MMGLRKARETVEAAAEKVTSSAQQTARAIIAVAAVAAVALLTALAALLLGARARRLARG